ncbi:AAA family ATPase [Mycolicibacterium sp. P9-22]|uniref:ATP-binding protein n=1 Tax=Mycolicibacterium sp. P9-22 TaxID=2024613 RepID=UPI0011EC9F87|nr:adenylate/guanylate cyclase domain-containing protein [Mycolicibacterium sp. P9-22]KAA0120475.1 adenylyl cyclase [Mycolicibacterium sp. P9-22]
MCAEFNGETIDELLHRAIQASNEGDRCGAAALANRILAVDSLNQDAEDLLSADDNEGELRRLTLLFIDLVDSTVLSDRVEPEIYRKLVISYQRQVIKLIGDYEGHIGSVKGDGLLAVFGHPTALEDDAHRGISAALDIVRAVQRLSVQAERKFGVTLEARIGAHRGLVYLDVGVDDVYGFAVNLTQRISGLAQPGTVAVSEPIAALVSNSFELKTFPATKVKGVTDPVPYRQVVGERATAPTGRPALVGRAAEQARLLRAWDMARQPGSGPAGVALRGEPGIGKTRLAQATAERVEQTGGRVIELRGSPLHRDAGLHPVRRLLERRCAVTHQTSGGERLRLLEAEIIGQGMDPVTAVPLLAPVLGVDPEHGYTRAAVEGVTLYQMIAAGVHDYLVACLGNRPGMILAEDVHWFDPSTTQIIGALLASPVSRHLVVITGRTRDWPQNDWPVEVLDVGPLTDDEADELIRTLKPELPPAQRSQVRARCDGVPFYLEHVVAALDDAALGSHVPDLLYSPLAAQLDAHSEAAPVIEAAAVIGRSGELALLRSVAGGIGTDVDAAVHALAQKGVFVLDDAQRWRFRHELIREVANELAPPSRCQDLHARTADAMVAVAGGAEPDWPVVAGHYTLAHRFDEAVHAYRRASIAARNRGALQEATLLLSNAVEQATHCPPGPDRDRTEIAVRLERGFLAGAMEGSWSGTGPADFERCLTLALDGGHGDELFDTLSAFIGYYVPRAELRHARTLLDSLSDRLTTDRPWSYPAVESSRGSVLWMQGEFTTARTHLGNALTKGSDADPAALNSAWWVSVDPVSVAHVFLALTAMVDGDLATAAHEIAESEHRCGQLGFPQNAQNRVHTFYMEIWIALEFGRLDHASAVSGRLRELSTSAGLDFWRFVSTTVHAHLRGRTALRDGADAETLLHAAHKLSRLVDGARQLNLNAYLTFHDTLIARLLLAAGAVEEARQRLDAALAHTAATEMNFYDVELLRIRAHCLPDRRSRQATTEAALALAHRQGAALFRLRCLLDLLDGGATDRRDELAEAVQALPAGAELPELFRARKILDPAVG